MKFINYFTELLLTLKSIDKNLEEIKKQTSKLGSCVTFSSPKCIRTVDKLDDKYGY